MTADKRPDPRPRKHAALWQTYLWWYELMEMRKRHNLRIIAAERGKTDMSAEIERAYLDALSLETVFDQVTKAMHKEGEAVGPIWDWLTGIKGVGPNLAAKLLALIDYPAPFPGSYPDHCATISKLRRFAGYAVIDGEIDRPTTGHKLPYNKALKSLCWQIAHEFVLHQTPVYVDIYYAEKERQQRLHPVPLCNKCDGEAVQVGQSWRCPECKRGAGITGRGGWGLRFTPAHIEKRAVRQTVKIFLSHLWVKWREFEGLPISDPYEKAILGHTNIIEPPE